LTRKPVVALTSPTPDATVPGPQLPAELTISHPDELGTDAYAELTVDGTQFFQDVDLHQQASVSTSLTITSLTPGVHQLSVEIDDRDAGAAGGYWGTWTLPPVTFTYSP
jgi:hypothetical protein